MYILAEPERIDPDFALWVQVWRGDRSRTVLRNNEATLRPIPQSRSLAEGISTVTVDGDHMRILTERGTLRGPFADTRIVIQVGRSEESIVDAQLHELMLMMVLGLPVAMAVAGVGGYVLARRALAPVEHSYEQMRRFTADVSHQLRTPLTAIRSVGEVGLRAGRRDESNYRTIIGSMLEETDRLAVLVDRLLTLSRAETKQALLQPDAVNLAELAEDVAGHLGVLAEEKGQSLSVDAAGAPTAVADRLVLRQALINLVDNAIKFTPAGGRISIRVSASDGTALVDVSDTGPGIPIDSRGRIFDRFYRGDDDAGTGTGLGLSIAKGAVEANGGALTLAHSGPDGTTFRMTLPRG
jgi:signal transduction histidine kinase